MKRKRWLIVIVALLGICVLVGLLASIGGGGKATPTATPTATPKPAAQRAAPVATEAAAVTAAPLPTDTPAPTATPAPTNTPAPTAAPQVFEGNGQQASPKFELPAGLVTFQMTHDGQSNFIAHLLDDQGQMVDSLANIIGPYNGSKALGVSAGTYLMDINADGNWTITVHNPVPAEEGIAVPVQGNGDQAIVFLKLAKGLATFKMTHDGQSNFIVHLLDDQGQLVDGLVNVIGPFDGSKALRIPSSGYYVIDVMADGAWSISEEQ